MTGAMNNALFATNALILHSGRHRAEVAGRTAPVRGAGWNDTRAGHLQAGGTRP